MKVGSILLRPIVGRTPRTVLTTTSVGMYQIGSGMYEWATDLANRLIQRRGTVGRPLLPQDALEEYRKDPEWVNDDTLIISRCLQDTGGRAQRSTRVALVSSDRRLANQLSNTCNVAVVLIDPASYIRTSLSLSHNPVKEMANEILSSFIPDMRTGRPLDFIYVDTGSVNAHLARIASATDREMKVIRHVRASGGKSIDEPRTWRYDVLTIPVLPSIRGRTIFPVQKPKRFRGSGSIEQGAYSVRSKHSRSLSSKSWREKI